MEQIENNTLNGVFFQNSAARCGPLARAIADMPSK